jgi:DNA-binding protein H-NS
MSVNEVVAGKSLDELMELQAAAQNEIEAAKARAIAEFEALVEEVKEQATKLGLSVKTYFVEKKDYPPKFKNPNGEETWNGRGPNPDWMKALLEGVPKEQWKTEKAKYLIAE